MNEPPERYLAASYPEPDILDLKIRDIKKTIYEERVPIRGWEMRLLEYLAPGKYRSLSRPVKIEPGIEWDNSGITCLFTCQLKIPEELLGREVYLELEPGGESALYINGRLRRGVNERDILLSPAAEAEYALRIEATRDFQKGVKYPRFFNQEYPRHYFKTANLVVKNQLVEGYYYLLRTVKAALDSSAQGEDNRHYLKSAVDRSLQKVNFFTDNRREYLASIEEADSLLNDVLSRLSLKRFEGLKRGKIFISGHSHLDLAYKWPVKETIRKAGRTLATAVDLLDRYGELYFIQSQPQIFAYLKEHYPRLYGKVREKIQSGRLEPVGAMWVESDTNLPSGESLVRQIIYGQGFLQEEFGFKSEICWLPDTFGFSGALPQILKKAGLKYFFTTKLTWNDTDQYPHNLMRWQGIDGSSINAYLLPRGYEGELKPADLCREWKDFREKEEGGEVLYLYGYGDGGGGVTSELLETVSALKKIPGLPELKTGPITNHFRQIFVREDDLPGWRGELYFEKHRGVYTSQALLKKKNRRCEFLYREAEIFTVLAGLRSVMTGDPKGRSALIGIKEPPGTDRTDLAGGSEILDFQGLKEGWKLILKNQFHDILPGSCTGEVAADALADYQRVEELGRKQRERALNCLIGEIAADPVQSDPDPGKPDRDFDLPVGDSTQPGMASGRQKMDSKQALISEESRVDNAGEERMHLAVFNSLSWSRSGLVKIELPAEMSSLKREERMVLVDEEGAFLPVQKRPEGYFAAVYDIPSLGYRTYRVAFSAGESAEGGPNGDLNGELNGDLTRDLTQNLSHTSSQNLSQNISHNSTQNLSLENKFYRLQFNSRGNLTSIYDKMHARELIAEGKEGNQLQIFEDKSTYFDAWDLNISEDKMWVIDEVEILEKKEEGPVYSSVTVRKRFNKSIIEQEIVIYQDLPRIDFHTRVDWQERQMLLKAAFPVDIVAERACYDIAFGNLERAAHSNTSWDSARSEVPAHKWADLSEAGYGVSLLNDCKYGYDVKGDQLRLTLLKGGIFPDPRADMGEHTFTYALYPHGGGFRRGGTVQAGYNLNQPLLARCFRSAADRNDTAFSFLEVEGENVILETIKRAEDGGGFIFRFYEAWGARSSALIKGMPSPVEIVECNLLEEPLEGGSRTAELSGRGFTFQIAPYEIKTFRISFGKTSEGD